MVKQQIKIYLISILIILISITPISASIGIGIIDYFDFEEADNPIITSQSDTSNNFLKNPSDNFTFTTSGIIGSRRITNSGLASHNFRTMEFNQNPLRNINLRNQPFTINFWFNTGYSASGSSGHIFFSLEDTQNPNSYFRLRITETIGASSIQLQADMSRTSIVKQNFNFGNIGSGQHHIVITSNGETIKAYRNGNLMNEFDITISQTPSNLNEYKIRLGSGQRGFVSAIDQLITYNKYLTQSEVQELYNGGVGVQTEELIDIEEKELEDYTIKPYPKKMVEATGFTKIINYNYYYKEIKDLAVLMANFQESNQTLQYVLFCMNEEPTIFLSISGGLCNTTYEDVTSQLGFNITKIVRGTPNDTYETSDFEISWSIFEDDNTLYVKGNTSDTILYYNYYVEFPNLIWAFANNEIKFVSTFDVENETEKLKVLTGFNLPIIKVGSTTTIDINSISPNMEGYWLQIYEEGNWKTYLSNTQTKHVFIEKGETILRLTGMNKTIGDGDLIRLIIYNDFESHTTETRQIRVEEQLTSTTPSSRGLGGMTNILSIFPSSETLSTTEKMFLSLFIMFITTFMLVIVGFATQNFGVILPTLTTILVLQVVFFAVIGYIPIWIIVLIVVLGIGIATAILKRPFTQSQI